ncbi:MAG TPA: polysaccharide deacetylase family protein [Clostridium sp.]|uniref:polysaccharide deacetylase family protein n=1 Tax=Clostridium sp. TaxID=1506 RepID=UPI002F91F4E7
MKLNNKRELIITKGKASLLFVMLVILLSLSFYINDKFYSKTIAITKNNTKETIAKPFTNAHMNSRESKVNLKEPFTHSSTTNVYNSDGHKIAYLTFDDGPSPKTTPGILKILDNYKIKATFFIVGSRAIIRPDLVKMEAEDGQSIGNHTYSHEYKYIYSNTNTFIKDVNKCDTVLKSIIGGYNSKILRFPGGSFGAKEAPFRVAIKKAGYHYIDWNDLTGDAEGQNIPVNKLLNNIKKNTKGKEHVVILMHDAPDKQTTVQALPQVIEYLKSQGYSFNTLK